jgi:SAM-dependent MidA family methyltransferase
VHLANQAFIRSLATMLTTGAVLLIDYGYGDKEYYYPERYQGTLRGFFRQHVLDSVLGYPGLIDITSSVNWSAITTTAIANGLEFIGYTTQGSFLINNGITTLLAKQQAKLSLEDYLPLSNQVNQLINPTEMGELFKVCGFSKGISLETWAGFSHNDRSYSL